MVSNALFFAAVSVALTSQVSAHISIWHPSMWGFNRTNVPVPGRPVDPLADMTFDQWWFHGHIPYPPHANDIMQLPAGGDAVVELACDKGATSYYKTNANGDIRDLKNPDYPCPNSLTTQFHTNGVNDLGGCALSVAYKSDINDVQPEDLVIFSVQQKCVWNLHTHFEVPKDMPPCPNGKCICAWHWIHKPDAGSEQMYMTGFQCDFTGSTTPKQLGKPKVARRCGAEPEKGLEARPWNCTNGPKSPLFWLQKERNNMFEGYYSPPLYQDLYNFVQGAQNDIFVDSVAKTPLPSSSPSSPGQNTASHTPTIVDVKATAPTTSPSSSPTPTTAHESSANPSAAPTSGKSEPSQSHYNHHKHKHTPCSSSSATPTHIPGARAEYEGEDEGPVRRAWGSHRRAHGGRHA